MNISVNFSLGNLEIIRATDPIIWLVLELVMQMLFFVTFWLFCLLHLPCFDG